MACEEYKFGDSIWDLVRKILGCLSGVAANVATLASGGTGTVGTSFGVASDIQVTVAGTAKQGPNVASPRGVMLVAALTNAGSVYIGSLTVTNASGGQRGIELVQGGMTSVVLPVANANQIYVNADNANDKVGIVVL